MSEKDNGLNWFWITMIVLVFALAVFGGLVTLKLLRSATPSVEKANADPEKLLAQNTAGQLQKAAAATSAEKKPEEEKFVAQDIDIEKWYALGKKPAPNTQTDENQTAETAGQAGSADDQTPADGASAAGQEGQETSAPAKEAAQDFSYTLEEVEKTPEPSALAPSKPAKAKPRPARPAKNTEVNLTYNQGLEVCAHDRAFPCSWQNTSQGFKRKYWWKDPLGLVERITYTEDGSALNRTLSTVEGVVVYYQGTFAELYFQDGLLTRIRTFPYENPNLRDWFVIDKEGKLSTCLCGISTKNCCGRSMLYRPGGHRKYCELFPLDTDFCSK